MADGSRPGSASSATASGSSPASRAIGAVVRSLKRAYGAPVIAHFVEEVGVDEDALREFERAIAERRLRLGQ